MPKEKIKILCCGGATGGHLYPAIALSETFQQKLGPERTDILFIGSQYGLESKVLPEQENFKAIWIRGIQRGWGWRQIKVNLLAPFRILVSLIQSYLYIKSFNPRLAIGTGGYSAGPPLYIADKLNIPIFLQEQNVYPGLTNRLLAKKAQKIYTAYEETQEYLENTDNKGIPLRSSLKRIKQERALNYFDLEEDKKTIFVFGGSQGSLALNNFLKNNIKNFIEDFDCQFIWQTGSKHFSAFKDSFKEDKNIYLTPYINRMDRAYSACDLVLSRAGALTLAEICEFGLPSILVPLPTAAANHQEKNARGLEKQEAAVVLPEKKLNYQKFSEILQRYLPHPEELKKMGKNARQLSNPDAATEIVNDIISILEIK
jgi:UDP-N-acetylglucosamine--N-acetylmuramyl-(pentapeptide) pyrophosphoryl-undecaprenol N-acetylglucosamine transferase